MAMKVYSMFMNWKWRPFLRQSTGKILIDKFWFRGTWKVWYFYLCYILTFLTRPKMPFQGDAPEGSDTFQWQLGEEIAWAEIGWWNGTS